MRVSNRPVDVTVRVIDLALFFAIGAKTTVPRAGIDSSAGPPMSLKVPITDPNLCGEFAAPDGDIAEAIDNSPTKVIANIGIILRLIFDLHTSHVAER
jgi:hypothetical protein